MEQNLPNNDFKNLLEKSGLIDKKTNINDLKIKDFSQEKNNIIEIKEIKKPEKPNLYQPYQSRCKCNCECFKCFKCFKCNKKCPDWDIFNSKNWSKKIKPFWQLSWSNEKSCVLHVFLA